MTMKKFTPAEANNTLPLAKEIVKDILNKAKECRISPDSCRNVQEEILSLIKELEDIGCTYKDWNFDVGLVDFPASDLNGKDILLCWRSDEEIVSWYHGLENGYSGRKPIPSEWLEELSSQKKN